MVDRTSRISEEIRKEVSEIIRYELKDPRIPSVVSVTSVNVTKDLSYAKIFISILGSETEKKDAIVALKKAAGFVRKEIGRRVKLRHTPEMLFELDNSIEEGMYLTDLINKTVRKDEEE